MGFCCRPLPEIFHFVFWACAPSFYECVLHRSSMSSEYRHIIEFWPETCWYLVYLLFYSHISRSTNILSIIVQSSSSVFIQGNMTYNYGQLNSNAYKSLKTMFYVCVLCFIKLLLADWAWTSWHEQLKLKFIWNLFEPNFSDSHFRMLLEIHSK